MALPEILRRPLALPVVASVMASRSDLVTGWRPGRAGSMAAAA